MPWHWPEFLGRLQMPGAGRYREPRWPESRSAVEKWPRWSPDDSFHLDILEPWCCQRHQQAGRSNTPVEVPRGGSTCSCPAPEDARPDGSPVYCWRPKRAEEGSDTDSMQPEVATDCLKSRSFPDTPAERHTAGFRALLLESTVDVAVASVALVPPTCQPDVAERSIEQHAAAPRYSAEHRRPWRPRIELQSHHWQAR